MRSSCQEQLPFGEGSRPDTRLMYHHVASYSHPATPTARVISPSIQAQEVSSQPAFVGSGGSYVSSVNNNAQYQGQLYSGQQRPSQGVQYAGQPVKPYTPTSPLTPTSKPPAIGHLDGGSSAVGATSTMSTSASSPPAVSLARPVSSPMAGGGSVLSQSREQVLEYRVRELEALVNQKDQIIKELQAALSASGNGSRGATGQGASKKAKSPERSGSGFRKVSDSKPVIRYTAVDQDDAVDVRLEEFYNSTGSAIQFRRINRGFYRFGDSIVELDIINHKLMARTEDGWNRGKFGPIEKFLMYYENIEREKAGIIPEK